MKLYTEEQVINALWATEHPFSDGKNVDEIMKSLSPIELPSDKDRMYMSLPKNGGSHSSDYMEGFNKGAKWVIEQIKQQNK